MQRVIPIISATKATGQGPWRPSRLLSAPHRLAFFSAALLMAVAALWWALCLFARWAGIALPWAVAPPLAHALFMTLGFMPLFIVGFAYTAGPRWLGLPDVAAPRLLKPVLAMVLGWLLALVGFHASASVAAVGVALVALGFGVCSGRFAALVRQSKVDDRLHAGAVAMACGIGVLALALAAWALAEGAATTLRLAAQLALWGFVAPSFVAVSHRMLPFFTASALPQLDAWRPNWILALLLATLAVCGAGAMAEGAWGALPPAVRVLQAALEAPAAALLLGLAIRWGLVPSLKVGLLAMLHGGFVWLGLALALLALSHGWQAAGGEGLGLAPTHALSMGYLGCTLIAMVTRVASGHSGRPLVADRLALALYAGVQLAALLRVAAALWPAAYGPLLLAAAVIWAAACSGWAWRYGGWLGRPRADGRPG
jgi:uncharacterized protein involved in response to NO